MNSLATFWANHGTKLLGGLIAINSGIALGATLLPPPLDLHATAIKAWAVFINVILGPFVLVRGYSNTSAIATAVSQQNMDKMVAAAKTGVPAVAATAGTLVKPAVIATPARPAPAPASAPRPRGFARPAFLLVLLVAATIAACALLSPQSIDSKLFAANQTVTAVEQGTDTALKAGLITSAQAQAVSTVAHQINPLIDSVRAAEAANNPTAANQTMNLITSLLDGLQAYVPAPASSAP